MDAITAYQLTSMMEGVVERGSGTGVDLPVPIAGKTGTTNDAKDVWFIGYTSATSWRAATWAMTSRDLWARALWRHAVRSDLSGVHARRSGKKYGGTEFPGARRAAISRRSTASAGAKPAGRCHGQPNVISEYFREGEEVVCSVWRPGGRRL